jgi:serine/threonine protein kinase
MGFSSGAELGPYRIVSALGAGGMGEVYRARDPRLGRDVAVKVLTESATADPDRLQRFEREAKAVGALNHPNLLAVFDIGQDNGTPYVVFELLEGETLRARLAKSVLALPKALDYATQIARGLAAAHDKGIVHRDLKPENLFVTRDGRVKILDFGLAKLRPALDAVEVSRETRTHSVETDAHTVLGTAGYMSPEQVRSTPSDHRSDIFSFGAVLYEMLSGRRAFEGETHAERMTAILTGDPPPLSLGSDGRGPAVERLVRHCFEKRREDRFQSARDLVFDLETLAAASSAPRDETARRAPRLLPRALIAILLLSTAGLAVMYLKERNLAPPSFEQATFRRQIISNARFAPDGQTILYTSTGEGHHNRIFSGRLGSPEVRSLDLPEGDIAAVSRSGELAIVVVSSYVGRLPGRLARVSLAGGAPRELLDGVFLADWSPDGRDLAVARRAGPKVSFEFPIGKVLYSTDRGVTSLRVSPKGDRIAFRESDYRTGAAVRVLDLQGKVTPLATTDGAAHDLAWSPRGDEIWFSEWGVLRAVALSGKQRVLARVGGPINLNDVSADGRALVTMAQWHEGLVVGGPGDAKERDLAWFERAQLAALSRDGKTVLFGDRGQGSGSPSPVHTYLRPTDGSPAVRLGEGAALSLSPDGKWAISARAFSPHLLQLMPTGPGETRPLPTGSLDCYFASWFPDGERLLVACNEPRGESRLYVQDVEGRGQRGITPSIPGFFGQVSPDGTYVLGWHHSMGLMTFAVDGGEPRVVPGLLPGEVPAGWGRSSDSLYVYYSVNGQAVVPMKIHELDLRSGRRRLFKEITPPDLQAFGGINRVVVAPGGTAYAYQYGQYLCILYVVEGLR